MAVNESYLRFSAIIGMLFSAGFFVLSIIYAFISNLSMMWITFLVVIALIEIIVFSFSVLMLLNPKRRIFFVGLIGLFAGLVPGIMILSFYFKTKRALIKNFENNT
ncbi:hypothetical protein [Spiroplasma platyhelix]|uniref:DUF4064 domain-containing protein n=1 Tax=Spiroplasma platyhelix PALS-1 TaxID=1276218 RepID=A0A846UDG3_9MOLU|nr:hypothetical protein [Spiroplasma platyhelix]MBE4704175.1 hypothetical protein [Spiroplasma platyhelix PALS-1]NKE38548.1 hypothetical protein [Spiroplasma platyhelix PALS-1]UJB29433.1 hypothetical protein SPLAT_v1c06690 [Spiroplasma platyhelix PALS-1]